MLAMKLIRLIEEHSEELASGLARKLQLEERTADFRKIPAQELKLAAAEVYRNLGEWLLRRTEADIEKRFRTIGARRAVEGVRLHQLTWALIVSRYHLEHFLQARAFADDIVALYGEMELWRILNQFFDRALYYAVLGFEETREQSDADRTLKTVRTGTKNWRHRVLVRAENEK